MPKGQERQARKVRYCCTTSLSVSLPLFFLSFPSLPPFAHVTVCLHTRIHVLSGGTSAVIHVLCRPSAYTAPDYRSQRLRLARALAQLCCLKKACVSIIHTSTTALIYTASSTVCSSVKCPLHLSLSVCRASDPALAKKKMRVEQQQYSKLVPPSPPILLAAQAERPTRQ